MSYRLKQFPKLFKIFNAFCKGEKREDIEKNLGITARQLTDAKKILKDLGFDVKFKASTDSYECDWSYKEASLSLNKEEFFYNFLLYKSLDAQYSLRKLQNTLELEAGIYYDVAKTAMNNRGVLDKIKPFVEAIEFAVRNNRYLSFEYSNRSGVKSERFVKPYRILTTQQSYFLLAYCEERQDLRTFKLTRMKELKVNSEAFTPVIYDVDKYLGDAWQIQRGEVLGEHKVKVIFHGAAASSIQEYYLHKSQVVTELADSKTMVEWELSELTEFTSWLMQWLGSFEIVEPSLLKNMVNNRIADFNKLHS